MDKLEKFELVNGCETAEDLEKAILTIAEGTNLIKGRKKDFDAQKMASRVKQVIDGDVLPKVLTREFGIRQQALYIKYYEDIENYFAT